MDGRLVWLLLAIIPLLLASSPVIVHPPNPVAIVGSKSYSFRCALVTTQIDRLQNVTWLLNGTVLESLDLIGVTSDFSTIGSGIGKLTFTNLLLEYNYTTIKCRGHLESGRNSTSGGVILLLQGTLVAVGDLSIRSLNSTVSLTWTAPFSFTSFEITYTVSVFSPASSSTLHMEDEITWTEFSYRLSTDGGCDNLLFTVMPQNGAGEGVPNSIALSQAIESPRLMELHSPTLAPSTGTDGVRDTLIYYISMSSTVCSAEITLTDKNTGEVITLGDMDLNISSTLMGITFTNENLALNRRYGFSLNASNINGSVISSGDISTYDVVNSGVHTNPLRIHTEFLPNSNAVGVLYGFFYIGESGIDFSRSLYFALSRNDSLRHELPSPLPAGVYYVHTYVIRENGLLSDGNVAPVTTEVFSGSGGTQVSVTNPPSSSEIDDCNISSTGLTVSVLCSYSHTSSSTGFMLVVQKRSIDSVRRLLVNSTEQGEPLGPVTVQVEVGGAYQVTVFPIREGMGILESNVAYTEEIAVGVVNNPTGTTITQRGYTPSQEVTLVSNILPIIIGVGSGLGILALLAIILGAVILVTVCHRSRGSIQLKDKMSKEKTEPSGKEKAVGLTVRSSLIYEEIGDAKSSFAYTQNVLYGQSTTTVSSHRLTSDTVPDVTNVSREAQKINDVKNSFSYTKNVTHGLSSIGVTLDPVPGMFTDTEPFDQEAKTDDYILMQTAGLQEKFDRKEDNQASCDMCDPNQEGGSSGKSCPDSEAAAHQRSQSISEEYQDEPPQGSVL